MPRPLSDMPAGEQYKGQDGGLYGGGRNTPPLRHRQAARRAASAVRPLAPDGSPSPSGLIGLLSVGFSNAYEEFEEFTRLAGADQEKSPAVRCANGAQAHMESAAWATGESGNGDPWNCLAERVERAGLTARQVQAAWIKVAPRWPAALGDFPEHAERTKRDLHATVTRLASRFPNLRLAYLSSRIYAGYAVTQLSPEPYAYEGAFALRWLIQDQIRGDPSPRCDPRTASPEAPLLLWGPYLWADGQEGRLSDGLIWTPEDFDGDGTHPSPTGARKVARLLLRFFRSDATSRPWFLGQPDVAAPGRRAGRPR